MFRHRDLTLYSRCIAERPGDLDADAALKAPVPQPCTGPIAP